MTRVGSDFTIPSGFSNASPPWRQISLLSSILTSSSGGGLCVTPELPLLCQPLVAASCDNTTEEQEGQLTAPATTAAAAGGEKSNFFFFFFYLATVSRDWITFSPVAALHSINSQFNSCKSRKSVANQLLLNSGTLRSLVYRGYLSCDNYIIFVYMNPFFSFLG